MSEKFEYLTIPSVSQPSWGGQFTFDIKEKNTYIHKREILQARN